jgi:hypothetical protein
LARFGDRIRTVVSGMRDLQTQIKSINLDAERRRLGITGPLYFERLEADRTWVVIGKVDRGYCHFEVQAETSSGLPEYQTLITARDGLDDLCRQAAAISLDGVRYEKRSVDPALTSPYVIRLRSQIVSGFASKGVA